MERSEILARLTEGRATRQEHPQKQEVREAAISLLSSTIEDAQLLHDLLSKVVRSLFLKQQHPNLTASGRKKLVPDAPIASRHSDTIDWDDESKLWRNGWTCDLLAFTLSQYRALPSDQEKSTFELQFHLLIPPILNLIDDGDVGYKTQGCKLLRLLCEEVTRCESEILKRTGLSDVFSDALRTNFMHLPTLTPEDESLMLLSELYPAFRALMNARFLPTPQKEPQENKEEKPAVLTLRPATKTVPATGTLGMATSIAKTETALNMVLATKDKDARQSMLDLILRHGILASYAHAVDYVRITTLLLREASLLISMMGIYSAKYLQMLLPLLRNVLSNPFASAYVPLLMSALECMETLVKTCWLRIREQWWGECLRGAVGCWVQIEDDKGFEKEQELELEHVKRKLRQVMHLLEILVGEDFENAKKRLLDEDDIIRGLFDDDYTDTDGVQGVS